MSKWRVTYRLNNKKTFYCDGVAYTFVSSDFEYPFEVEAPDEGTAIMRAGMKRAESRIAKILYDMWRPEILQWERVSVEQQ